MKILIFGLPDTGKTYLAERITKNINNICWFNADKVRDMVNDWDFSDEGRIRQSLRMKNYAEFESKQNRIVICDFIAPTNKARSLFNADFKIWMNTHQKSKYENTNKIFEEPDDCNIVVKKYPSDLEILNIIDVLKLYINKYKEKKKI
jgi:adenylylsulfate kinase